MQVQMPQEIFLEIAFFINDCKVKTNLLSINKTIRNSFMKIIFPEPDKYVYEEACKVVWQGLAFKTATEYFDTSMYVPESLRDLRKFQYLQMVQDPKFVLQYCNQKFLDDTKKDFFINELPFHAQHDNFSIESQERMSTYSFSVIYSDLNDSKVIICREYDHDKNAMLTFVNNLFDRNKNVVRLIFCNQSFYPDSYIHELMENNQRIKSCMIQDRDGKLPQGSNKEKILQSLMDTDSNQFSVRTNEGEVPLYFWDDWNLHSSEEKMIQFADIVKKKLFINNVIIIKNEQSTILDLVYDMFSIEPNKCYENMIDLLRKHGALYYEETVISSGNTEWIKRIDTLYEKHKNSLLHRAVQKNFKFKYIEQLVQIKEIDINRRNDAQDTALDLAKKLNRKNFSVERSKIIKLFRLYKMKEKVKKNFDF